MKMRRITSLTALISFLIILLTSIILYIVPQGRIAYWSDWHLWGLSKTQWGEIHINLGFLFILSILLHIYYNWKPIINYLKDRKKNLKIFTKDFNAALAVTVVVIIGTYFMIPPFSTVLDFSTSIKDAAALKYGEPPFGHAEEAPFDSLVQKTGLDFKSSVAKLEAAGIKLDAPNQIFLEIAKKHDMTPQQIFSIIKIQPAPGEKKTLPEIPPPGTGNRSLTQLCEEFQLDCNKIIDSLSSKGLKIDPAVSLRTLAPENNKSSVELYDLIRDVSKTADR